MYGGSPLGAPQAPFILVLDDLASEWRYPWWVWLLLGVVALVLLTCVASALLRATGVITDQREIK